MPKKPEWNETPCPWCKEPIAIAAVRCPHCQQTFTDAEIVKRKSDHRTAFGLGCLLLLLIIGALSWCTSRSDNDEPITIATSSAAPSPSPVEAEVSDATLQQARTEAEANWEQILLPKYAPEAPVTGLCQDAMCETTRVKFSRSDWPKAWRGDYQGQRNAAYCRTTGCDGAVIIDKIDGCAWRLVIGSMNAVAAQDVDASSLVSDCGRLNETSREMAATKADTYITMIKRGRP
ncbi:hypothetical protein GTZ99_03055 [Novosphingobium sp. FSY-8]|uniref:Zinc ribbon domain-containing protein n=1 Tax=Novosphingobium ovatum TaxID=1908523 RepID=A0ABW9XAH2_9SPHN|nr:hypothetical protein [Novosphingobium ovatum]NBC35530.1 hypothetical protein [Novosphingobium ovatum]